MQLFYSLPIFFYNDIYNNNFSRHKRIKEKSNGENPNINETKVEEDNNCSTMSYTSDISMQQNQ